MRSGLGAGIVIDGQIYRGADNRAGEIGDWPCEVAIANGPGKAAARKLFTRLEEIASLQSLRDRLARPARPQSDPQGGPEADASLEALLQAALAGDKVVLGFLDRVAQAFGLALNQLNCAFNPEKIILAGALTAFGERFLQPLEHSLQAFAPTGGAPAVVNSQLGPFNGAIGAAALAVHEWKPVPP
jgi:glucokinase